MSQYVFRSAQGEGAFSQENLLPNCSTASLYERGRVLLRLLSDRAAVRIICAPALYGKSVTAYQYAQVAFDAKNVIWVNAQSPHFVVDLDTDTLLAKLDNAAACCNLVVFDAVDTLSSKRYQSFFAAVDTLCKSGSEVLITTCRRELAASCSSPYLLLEACDLLLDEAELSQCGAISFFSGGEPAYLPASFPLYATSLQSCDDPWPDGSPSSCTTYLKHACVPVLMYDRDRGAQRFCEALLRATPESPDEALAMLALIARRGSQRVLDPFVSGEGARCVRVVAHAFPHAGFLTSGLAFEALPLACDMRLALLQTHFDTLVQQSSFTSEKEYIEELIGVLLAQSDWEFAHYVLQAFCDEDEARAVCEHCGFSLDALTGFVEPASQGAQAPEGSDQATPGSSGAPATHTENNPADQACADQACAERSLAYPLPCLYKRELPLALRPKHGQSSNLESNGRCAVRHDRALRNGQNVPVALAIDRFMGHSASLLTSSANTNQFSGEDALAGDRMSIRLFGGFELRREGKRIPPTGEVRKKAKLLIALLVVNRNKELPRFWIERLIWPDTDEKRARSSFYNLWSYVRHLLADPDGANDRLYRSRDTVLLRDTRLESDVIEVDQWCSQIAHHCQADQCRLALRSIEELYQGSLLPGIENAQLEAYRSTYETKVLDAVVQGIDILSKQGDLRSALHYSSYAFALDPTREDVCYLFMTIQKRLGQFTGAMSTFMGCRKALVDRFGVDGSRRLDALYEEILHEVS